MRRYRGALWALALSAAACAPAPPAGPPELRLGLDECSRCRMIVSELGSAAVARGPAGEEARFDDLTCLAELARQGALDGWRIWAHVEGEDPWQPVEGVRFTRDPDRITPMGSGWTAVSAAAGPSPDAVDWPQLVERTGKDPRS